MIPLLQKEMEQNTGQYNMLALGGRELLWGQQRCGRGLVRKVCLASTRVFVQLQSSCVKPDIGHALVILILILGS